MTMFGSDTHKPNHATLMPHPSVVFIHTPWAHIHTHCIGMHRHTGSPTMIAPQSHMSPAMLLVTWSMTAPISSEQHWNVLEASHRLMTPKSVDWAEVHVTLVQ